VIDLDVEIERSKMELINGGVEMNGRRWSPSTGALREEIERVRFLRGKVAMELDRDGARRRRS
jgi:hypothetical protein